MRTAYSRLMLRFGLLGAVLSLTAGMPDPVRLHDVGEARSATFGCGGDCIPCGLWWYAGEPIFPDQGNYSHLHATCDLTGNGCRCSSLAGDPGSVDAAVALVAAGTMEGLREALSRYPDVARIDIGRLAVQVEGCSGAIVAQAPLSPSLMASLVTEFRSLAD